LRQGGAPFEGAAGAAGAGRFTEKPVPGLHNGGYVKAAFEAAQGGPAEGKRG